MTLILFFSLILNSKPSISSLNDIDNTKITIEHAITITNNENGNCFDIKDSSHRVENNNKRNRKKYKNILNHFEIIKDSNEFSEEGFDDICTKLNDNYIIKFDQEGTEEKTWTKKIEDENKNENLENNVNINNESASNLSGNCFAVLANMNKRANAPSKSCPKSHKQSYCYYY